MGWLSDLLQGFTRAAPDPSPQIAVAPGSSEIAAFIKGWEACSLTPYKDIAGHWTIGWGHLMAAYEPLTPITQERADLMFATDLAHMQADVAAMVRYVGALPQHYAALASFAFNLGIPALRTSTLLQKVNEGDFPGAGNEFKRWNKARDRATGLLVVVDGLTKRRKAECAIFTAADYSGRP